MISTNINSLFNSLSYRCDSMLLDPGDEWDGFDDVSIVLLTHAHFDHIYGLNRVIELNPNVKIYTNESGREMLLNARKNMSYYNESPFVISNPSHIVTVEDGEEIPIGKGLTAKAIFTAGHNPSCITWLIGDSLFTGDSYIPGIKVVTNLPGGNKEQAEESIALIKRLSDGKTIYSGHKIEVKGFQNAGT